MVDQHPFLLEALARINNNTFFSNNTSRQHVIFYHPQPVHVFLHLNNSSSNKWFNFKVPSWSIYTIIPFLACSPTRHLKPIMPKFYHVLAQGQAFNLQLDQSSHPFNYIPQFFAQHFVRIFDYPILQLQASLDVCAHIPSTLWVSTSYVVLMAMNTLEFMMQFTTPLSPLHKMLVSTWDENNYIHFFQPHSIPLVDRLTLCLPKMTFTP
jgi:hypothetical protein